MYEFLLYTGKTETSVPDNYNHLQKCAQIVTRLCEHLHGNIGHKLFFENWFTTIDLLIYLKEIGILAIGTVWTNCLQGCPLERNKAIERQGREPIDYRVDLNIVIFIVSWMDNSIVQLASNFVGIETMGTLNRRDSLGREKKDIACPKIVSMYNKRMGVHLADMLIALYRIQCKTTRWYIKTFWHMVDIIKADAWILYKREEILRAVSEKSLKFLKMFSLEIANALIYAMMPACRGSPIIPNPVDDVRYDNIGYWPVPVSDKKRCCLCQRYARMTCQKCKVTLCLLQDCNCFIVFHT